MKKTLLALAMMAGMTTAAHANVSVSANNGTLHITNGITGFQTFGDMMDGMTITGLYNNVSTTAIWADTGSGCGAANAGTWSVSMCGDTFGGTWTVTNASDGLLRSLSFDGSPGRTLFDRGTPPPNGFDSGTPDSARGWDVTNNDVNLQLDVTYTDILGIAGDPLSPYFDLYTRVNMFINGGNGIRFGSFGFIMDTDNATSDVIKTPEPGSLLLMGLGLLGLGAARRRRA